MRQQVINILLIVGAVALLLWPLARVGAATTARIDAADLARRLSLREPLLLLDVRTPPELEDGIIAGVVSVPLDQLAGRIEEVRAHVAERPETGVIVVCRSGSRAVSAARILDKAGFAKVAILSGGMIAWTAAGQPVVRPSR